MDGVVVKEKGIEEGRASLKNWTASGWSLSPMEETSIPVPCLDRHHLKGKENNLIRFKTGSVR